MGNSSNENICYCQNIVDINFHLQEIGLDKCNIWLIKNYEICGFNNSFEDIIFNRIEKIEGLEEFITLINKILHNFNLLPKEKISNTLNSLKDVLSELAEKDNEVNSYLNDINSFQSHKFQLKSIKKCISLFVFIFDKKEEIEEDTIKYFIKSIYFLFKTKEVLNENENNFFNKKLKEIFSIKEISKGKDKNFSINNTHLTISNPKNNENSLFETNNNEISKIENDNKSIGTGGIGWNFSENFCESANNSFCFKTKNNIPKPDRQSQAKQDKIFQINKYIITFSDEKEKEEYNLNIFLNENDNFSKVVNIFYEFFPKFKGRNIIFSINIKQNKEKETIKNCDFDNSTKIFIEYLE